MNDVEMLIKLIIPAILLVFWALSNLFNRDNAAARDGSPRPSPLGPRPSAYPARDRLSGSPTMTPPRPGVSPRDDVMIIRAETPPPRPAQPRRNAGRPRREPNPPPRRPVEPTPSRTREQVGGRISADVNQALPTSIDLRPLAQSLSDARVDAASAATFAPPEPSSTGALFPDLRAALMDPARVREAFVLNMILSPPLSMRDRRRPGS